jgi:hypothetical protein
LISSRKECSGQQGGCDIPQQQYKRNFRRKVYKLLGNNHLTCWNNQVFINRAVDKNIYEGGFL